MTPDEAVRGMAARLATINWERRGDKTWSKVVLLKEYFRRAAQWAAAYDCDSRVPFFDIARCVDASVEVPEGVLDGLLATVEANGGGRNVTQVIPFILRWSALQAASRTQAPPYLEDPFEPLILLFERGGGFHTEHGEVDLEWKSVRMAGWRNRADDPPLPSFDPAYLDEIDRAGSTAQFGYGIEPL
ncbi:hypothetical protein [Actinoplanes siamensis]|uniref:Uncharacterized protein n=1 Tax=Actinoplanes siamensis TaxID=1223317 RepID=A0A919NEQ4_9ACTN|nr:hypothetical protein [Actinoplanes siamensis]GIF09776.1 hypothetical protein Asi03nite_73140 [Actinoplanes siamensis]